MIYMTEFDSITQRATGPSVETTFETLADVAAVMGEPLTTGPRQVIYPGLAFSDHQHFGAT